MDTRMCAFCGRGEKSLMGQGELVRFEPTPGFNPFKKSLNRSVSKNSDDGNCKKTIQPSAATCRRSRSLSRNQSQSSLDVDGQSQLQDELFLIGFQDDVDVTGLFEKTGGHVMAHQSCALWSAGVVAKDDGNHLNVDVAVFNGLMQKCAYCNKYGATIVCLSTNCLHKYHYPCASGGGCFQNIKNMSLLCPDHCKQAVKLANQEACCVVCDVMGSMSDQLFCTSCGQHYHGNCLDPTVEVSPVVRAGWQCPECKICQTCRQPGDDNKMLVCDRCDKGYHTFCLKPAMSTIPKNGWKCKVGITDVYMHACICLCVHARLYMFEHTCMLVYYVCSLIVYIASVYVGY
ncbi:hypothetical protein HELRODRAFT_78708 [Helobdella robusta]|uniref:PHD-type domain-containing protein n=1 Tax=Helobdella robusta TaxID=6412 RepID=T1G3E8_HELRO|nr:hypothetical protein HELRODRAFT_78708 [Helobdella robusta]ESO04749.1 hypothetical protein HELRODRAFT_78708 [Helobdella robusta]